MTDIQAQPLRPSYERALVTSRYGFLLVQLVLLAIAIFSIGVAISIGQVHIPLGDSFRILVYKLSGIEIGDIPALLQGQGANIIWNIRFPRVLLALLIGAGLSLCGTIMQAAVQNPLADPYILGVSSGATLGATFAIMIGFGSIGFLSQMGVAFGAFAGAFGAAMMVMVLAGLGGKMSSVKLVLSGMVINALCTAFANFIIYLANNTEGIRTVTFWTMGSLAAAKWDKLPLVAIVMGLAVLFFLLQSRILNTMLMGDEAAVTLGINLSAYRRLYLLLTAIVTGVLVASCGMIGFVGLIIPHLIRGLVGSDHRRLLPTSIWIGGIFLVWTDLLARVLIPKVELPIGIITALIGGPLFMYMLIKKGYSFGGK
ncbi:FecCD family ABC transporter permease [Cohnella thailandensis]|uniref:Iron ABC transporter permease n=1 Tax=Cohnella thailandensis TaxID=557557 RepID=A0A841SQZ0_9BACL|nr:iron ABC transporter permease [Cohnella thailandensis]MBB6633026.1 iron ABC transporter permease [Cohnella thailandensis]MBP1975279.1 iron complex transport system permease protein [Cohnella thailandensis]